MIMDEKAMDEALDRLRQEFYDFIDSLAIYNDHKAELKMRWNNLNSMARTAWNYSHPHED